MLQKPHIIAHVYRSDGCRQFTSLVAASNVPPADLLISGFSCWLFAPIPLNNRIMKGGKDRFF